MNARRRSGAAKKKQRGKEGRATGQANLTAARNRRVSLGLLAVIDNHCGRLVIEELRCSIGTAWLLARCLREGCPSWRNPPNLACADFVDAPAPWLFVYASILPNSG
jgi:hypothetical protein